MNLEELRAQARAVASRMEARLSTALGASRGLGVDEEAANTADERELADLKTQITAAEAAAAAQADDPATPVKAATHAERARILALADLCPSSVFATPLRTAITDGVEAGAFAIVLATASKARGASMTQLRDGAVDPSQLPAGKGADAAKPKTGAARGQSIVARAAALGHSAVAHLAPKG